MPSSAPAPSLLLLFAALLAAVPPPSQGFVLPAGSAVLPRHQHHHSRAAGTVCGAGIPLIEGEEEFDELLGQSKPVLVDFFADWCGPCKLVEPFVTEAAETFGDDLKVVKVDIDVNRGLVKRYGLRGLPYLALFKGGEKVDGIEGAIGKDKVMSLVKKNTGL